MTEKSNDEIMKKAYPSFQKKFNLPTLESLEQDFGIIDVEHEKYLLTCIRKRMNDKIEYYLMVLGNIFEGDATLSNIYESKVFDEESKTELFKIYKRLMRYSRQSNILTLSYDERAESDFVKDFHKEWQTIKQEIKKHLILFRDTWNNDTNTNEDILNYLG